MLCKLLVSLFSTDDSMIDIWKERFPLPDNDFEFLEPVLALRTSMLQTLVTLRKRKSHSPEKLARAYKDLAIHLEMQAKTARSHNPQVHSNNKMMGVRLYCSYNDKFGAIFPNYPCD